MQPKRTTGFNVLAEAISRARPGSYEQPTNDEQGEGDPLACAAHGCPMPGTCSDQIAGEVRRRWCACHFQRQPHDLPAITQRLRNRGWLVEAVRWLRRSDPHMIEAIVARLRPSFEQAGRQDLLPQEVTLDHSYTDGAGQRRERIVLRNELRHPQLWLHRLEATLVRECAAVPRPDAA